MYTKNVVSPCGVSIEGDGVAVVSREHDESLLQVDALVIKKLFDGPLQLQDLLEGPPGVVLVVGVVDARRLDHQEEAFLRLLRQSVKMFVIGPL